MGSSPTPSAIIQTDYIMYLICDHQRFNVETFLFNGGEVSVKVPPEIQSANKIRIVSLIRNSNDLIALLMANDAVRRVNPSAEVSASIPYVPYARQDRVCNPGESLSIKVVADLINSCNFHEVFIADPHSDVTPALINNVYVYEQHHIVENRWTVIGKRELDNPILVSPDAGANKKTMKLAQTLGMESFIRADKIRDVSNGKITGTVVYCDDLKGRDVLMVDDICDGGYTFIKLAEALKEKGAGKIGLAVTHGIFSKGKEVLFEHIDQIYSEYDWSDINYVRNN